MVVFTCNHCGEALSKPKVEKHYQFVCRKPVFVTCVDCLKDFRGNEFDVHIKCVSEDQRYAAKGSSIVTAKKGEVKQESWVEMIRSIIKEEQDLKPSHRNLLNRISSYNNVPRKKPKFMNYIKNIGGRINMNDVEAVWDIIERYKARKSNATLNNDIPVEEVKSVSSEKTVENGDSDNKPEKEECTGIIAFQEEVNENKKKEKLKSKKTSKRKPEIEVNSSQEVSEVELAQNGKTKKRKHSNLDLLEESTVKKSKTKIITQEEQHFSTNELTEGQTNGNSKMKKKHTESELSEITEDSVTLINGESTGKSRFNFKYKIIEILEKINSAISPEKLQKKIKKSYVRETGEEFSDKVQKKYLKKLKQLENVIYTEDSVKLLSQMN